MKIKINEFKEVIKKATLNYVIPSIQLKFKNKKIISNMMTQAMDAVIMLTMDNNVLDIPVTDDLEFNFSNPDVNVKPYLDLVDEDSATAKVTDENIKIVTENKQRTTFHFSSPTFVSSYGGNQPSIDSWFFEENLDDDLMGKFNKIKRIAGKFGKIYFSIVGNKLFVEATDKQNKFSNSMRFELGVVDHKDFNLCFNFNNINALLTLISHNYTDFEIKLHVAENEDGGMLLFKKMDGSEYYYFVSKNE